jgi:hypothetical protein
MLERGVAVSAGTEKTIPQKHPGGRPKGSPNKASIARAAAIAASGLTPLDYMLQQMRDDNADPAMRLDAARSAAPYVHPRLAQTQLTGKDGGPIQIEDKAKAELIAQIFGALQGKT